MNAIKQTTQPKIQTTL